MDTEVIIQDVISPTPVIDFDFIGYLQLMANALKFTVRYLSVDKLANSGHHQAVVELDRAPYSEFYGIGATMEDAQNDAARMAVQFLQVEARYVEYFTT